MATLHELPVVLLFLFLCITAISAEEIKRKSTNKFADQLLPNVINLFRNPVYLKPKAPEKFDWSDNQNTENPFKSISDGSKKMKEVEDVRSAVLKTETTAIESDAVYDTNIKKVNHNHLAVESAIEVGSHNEYIGPINRPEPNQPVAASLMWGKRYLTSLRQRVQRPRREKRIADPYFKCVPGEQYVLQGATPSIMLELVSGPKSYFSDANIEWRRRLINIYEARAFILDTRYTNQTKIQLDEITKSVQYRMTIISPGYDNAHVTAAVIMEDDRIKVTGSHISKSGNHVDRLEVQEGDTNVGNIMLHCDDTGSLAHDIVKYSWLLNGLIVDNETSKYLKVPLVPLTYDYRCFVGRPRFQYDAVASKIYNVTISRRKKQIDTTRTKTTKMPSPNPDKYSDDGNQETHVSYTVPRTPSMICSKLKRNMCEIIMQRNGSCTWCPDQKLCWHSADVCRTNEHATCEVRSTCADCLKAGNCYWCDRCSQDCSTTGAPNTINDVNSCSTETKWVLTPLPPLIDDQERNAMIHLGEMIQKAITVSEKDSIDNPKTLLNAILDNKQLANKLEVTFEALYAAVTASGGQLETIVMPMLLHNHQLERNNQSRNAAVFVKLTLTNELGDTNWEPSDVTEGRKLGPNTEKEIRTGFIKNLTSLIKALSQLQIQSTVVASGSTVKSIIKETVSKDPSEASSTAVPSKLDQLMRNITGKELQLKPEIKKIISDVDKDLKKLKEGKKSGKESFKDDKKKATDFFKSLRKAADGSDETPESEKPLDPKLLTDFLSGFASTIGGNNSKLMGDYAEGFMAGAIEEAKADPNGELNKLLKQIQGLVEKKGVDHKQTGQRAAVKDLESGGEATKKLSDTIKKGDDSDKTDNNKETKLLVDRLNTKLKSGKLNLTEVAEQMGKDEKIQKLVNDMFTGKHTDTTEPVKPEFRAKVPDYIKKLAKKYKDKSPKSESVWKIAEKIALGSDKIKDQVARMLEKMDKTKKGITADEAAQKTLDKMKNSPELGQLEEAIMDNFKDNFQVDKKVKADLKSNFTKMFDELDKQSKKSDEKDNKKIGKKFAEKQVEPTKGIIKSLTKSIKLPEKRRRRRQASQNQIDAVRAYAQQLITLSGLPAALIPNLQDLLEGILNAAANAPPNSPLRAPIADLEGTGPNAAKGSDAATNDASLNNGLNSLDLGKQLTNGLNNMNNDDDDPPGSSYWWIGVIVGVVVVLIIVLVVVICLVTKKKKEKPVDEAVVLVVVAAEEPDLISETMSDQVGGGISYVSLPGTSLPPTQCETEPTQPSVEESQQIINVNIIHIKADGSDSLTDDTDTDDVIEQTAADETSVPFTEERNVFKEKKKVKRSEKKKKQEDKKQKRETKIKEQEEKSKDWNQQIIIIHDDSQPAKDKDETPQTTQDSEDKTKNQQQQQEQQIVIIHQNAPSDHNSLQPEETQSGASKDVKQRDILIVNDNQPKSNGEKYESVVQRNPATYQQVTKQNGDEKQPENQDTKEVRYLELIAVPSETKSKVKSVQQKESSQKISKSKDEPSIKETNMVSSKSKTQSVKDKQTKSIKDVTSQQTKEAKQQLVTKAHEEPRYEPVGGTEDDVTELQKKPKSLSESKEPKKETVITVTTITTTNQDGVEVTDVQ